MTDASTDLDAMRHAEWCVCGDDPELDIGPWCTCSYRDHAVLVAEVERLRDGIRDLHQPMDEEAELHHDGDLLADLDGDCPDDDGRGCPGHMETIQVCSECGYEHNGDYPIYRSWPCPTAALLDDRTETT